MMFNPIHQRSLLVAATAAFFFVPALAAFLRLYESS